MSDPAGALRPVLETYLRADAGVIAAFGSKAVKVFITLPPINAVPPYIFVAGLFVDDRRADCLDAAAVDLQVDVWSLMNPPGFTEAEAIAKAVRTAIHNMEDVGDSPALFTVSGWRVVAVGDVSANYLTDPSDGKTVHAVVRANLSVDPVA